MVRVVAMVGARIIINGGRREVVVIMISVARRLYIVYFWEAIKRDRRTSTEKEREVRKRRLRK